MQPMWPSTIGANDPTARARDALDDPVQELEAIGVALIHRAHRDHDSGGGVGGYAGVSITPAYPYPRGRAVDVPPQAE
jgi:hypothetical protein